MRLGLRDAEEGVRGWSARFYKRHEMSDADWELLKDAAEQEKDESTRKEMHEVLAERETRPAEPGD